MQKKLIALAVAGLASTAALAQSNVTVYGRVDYGYMTRSGNSGGVTGINSKKEFAPGIQAGSRVGFKGAEDLGNGLKAIFEIESGISNDASSTAAGTSGLFTANRHSYVGLTGNFGTVVGGRLDGVRYGVYNKYDAFGGGGMGNFTQMTAQVDRANNAIAYISPSMSGFGLTLAYATAAGVVGPAQEQVGNVGDGELNTIMGTYDNGPISLALDWEQVKQKKGSGKVKVNTVGGSYDFGVVKVSGLWDSLKSDFGTGGVQAANLRAYFLSAKVPVMGKAAVKVTWGKVDDKMTTNADATKWGVGFDYNLSPRTGLFADYGKIRNKNDLAAYQISPAANSQGAGYGVKGFDLGIAHKF